MRVNRRTMYNLPPLNIKIGDTMLEEVTEYKYLGATIDNKLTFRPHVNNVIKTISHKLHLLARIRKFFDEEQAIL